MEYQGFLHKNFPNKFVDKLMIKIVKQSFSARLLDKNNPA